MGDEQKTGRVRIVMAPGDLRAIHDGSFERRSRSEAIRRPIRLGLNAEKRRAKPAAAPAEGQE